MYLLPRILPCTESALLNKREFNIASRSKQCRANNCKIGEMGAGSESRAWQRLLNRGGSSGCLALITSVATCLGLPLADFHSARGTAPMILRSLRFALPLFLLAFAASSLATLWPNPLTRWLLRKPPIAFGLGFAFGMAWHLSFVGYSIFCSSFWVVCERANPQGNSR